MRVHEIDRTVDLDAVPGSREIEPLNVLQALADQHAHALGGENCARGTPLPLHDMSGAVCAVLFSYALEEDVHRCNRRQTEVAVDPLKSTASNPGTPC